MMLDVVRVILALADAQIDVAHQGLRQRLDTLVRKPDELVVRPRQRGVGEVGRSTQDRL